MAAVRSSKSATTSAVGAPATAAPASMVTRNLGRRDRMARILERDGNTCIWCGRKFTGLVDATTEHVVPRLKGGPSWIENEVAACRRCNGERGHAAVGDWAQECLRRGWVVDLLRARAVLEGLDAAIAVRGGRRRARVYAGSQLRRIRNLGR